MRVGVVGLGVVGGTIKIGMEELGNDVIGHDIQDNTSIADVLDTQLCYICVPTPSNDDGGCDTRIVESVIRDLDIRKYNGIICVKSTVAPGTTQRLAETFPSRKLAFVPEFLRERCALADFTENHDVCIIGCEDVNDFEQIKKSHGHFPRKFVRVTPTEAEFCKYFNNTYNALLITFANSFYEVCTAAGVEYEKIKGAIINRDHIVNRYLDCNKNLRGFGGVCLPKDTAAMDKLCEDLDTQVRLFKNILAENKKYKMTVMKGMRKR